MLTGLSWRQPPPHPLSSPFAPELTFCAFTCMGHFSHDRPGMETDLDTNRGSNKKHEKSHSVNSTALKALNGYNQYFFPRIHFTILLQRYICTKCYNFLFVCFICNSCFSSIQSNALHAFIQSYFSSCKFIVPVSGYLFIQNICFITILSPCKSHWFQQESETSPYIFPILSTFQEFLISVGKI